MHRGSRPIASVSLTERGRELNLYVSLLLATLCRQISKTASFEVYPQLAISKVSTVVYNSTFFHLKRGSVDISCTMKRNMIWLNAPEFGTLLF